MDYLLMLELGDIGGYGNDEVYFSLYRILNLQVNMINSILDTC